MRPGGTRIGRRRPSSARRARSWMPWSPRPVGGLGRAAARGGLASPRQGSASERRSRWIAGDWELWYHLASASSGDARSCALRQATRLFPRAQLLRATSGAGPNREALDGSRLSHLEWVDCGTSRSTGQFARADSARLLVRRLPRRRRARCRRRHERGLRARTALPRELRPVTGRAAGLADRASRDVAWTARSGRSLAPKPVEQSGHWLRPRIWKPTPCSG